MRYGIRKCPTCGRIEKVTASQHGVAECVLCELARLRSALAEAEEQRDRAIRLCVSAMESRHTYRLDAAVRNVAAFVGASEAAVSAAAGLDAKGWSERPCNHNQGAI
jgi:hypothetical protein